MGREVIEISYKIAPSLLNQQEEREREEKRQKNEIPVEYNWICSS